MPGDSQPGTHRIFIHQQTVTVPSQPGAEREIALPDQVLNECRLFPVLPAIGKPKGGRSIAIENTQRTDAEGCDAVSEVLMDRAENRIASGFPFVCPVVPGDRGSPVRFAEAAVLLRQYRRRQRIRPEPGCDVPSHGAERAQQPR